MGAEAPGAPLVHARGLVRRFGSFTAVDGVDLQVDAGEVFGLLGANGAGKTTTIRMLCGTLPPSAGQAEVAGVDIVRHPRRARGRIGYVTQGFALYGELSLAENLVLQAGLYGLPARQRRQRLAWALERLELGPWRDTRAAELPLGYRRRLDFAAALLHEPRVLFLDEPTSGVDPLARQEFWDLVYELAGQGMAILVTTHYMDEAAFCDRLALMHAGRLLLEDTPRGLLGRPLPTPLLEVRGRQCAACAKLFEAHPGVREIIPHAGYLRLRLQPGTDPRQVAATLGQAARAGGLEIDEIRPARPDLEDVFVAVLEEAAA